MSILFSGSVAIEGIKSHESHAYFGSYSQRRTITRTSFVELYYPAKSSDMNARAVSTTLEKR